MLTWTYRFIVAAALFVLETILAMTLSVAQQPTFRNAPVSSAEMKNPYTGSATAAAAGKKLYAQDCAQCHGNNLQGMGPAPPLDTPSVRNAKAGELFWFISTGKLTSGMPSWSNLPKQQRWQLITFLESRSGDRTAAK